MINKEKLDLYNEAIAFYELAECGREHIPEKNYVESYIPYIVNMTFCTELLLKLLLIENGKSINELRSIGHNLHKLYNELPTVSKDTIYQSFRGPMIYSIEKELEEIQSAFVDWRYLVLEKANGNIKKLQVKPFFLKELNEILRDICKNI